MNKINNIEGEIEYMTHKTEKQRFFSHILLLNEGKSKAETWRSMYHVVEHLCNA